MRPDLACRAGLAGAQCGAWLQPHVLDQVLCQIVPTAPALCATLCHLVHRAWKFGNGGVVAISTATTPSPPNFWTCGEPCGPDDMVLCMRSGPQVRD